MSATNNIEIVGSGLEKLAKNRKITTTTIITYQTDLDSADDVHGASKGRPDVEKYSYCSSKLGTQRPWYHEIWPWAIEQVNSCNLSMLLMLKIMMMALMLILCWVPSWRVRAPTSCRDDPVGCNRWHRDGRQHCLQWRRFDEILKQVNIVCKKRLGSYLGISQHHRYRGFKSNSGKVMLIFGSQSIKKQIKVPLIRDTFENVGI